MSEQPEARFGDGHHDEGNQVLVRALNERLIPHTSGSGGKNV